MNLNSQPLTFIFQLQAQCTSCTFIGPLIFENQLCLYKNSINDYMIQFTKISVEFEFSNVPLNLQLFLKLTGTYWLCFWLCTISLPILRALTVHRSSIIIIILLSTRHFKFFPYFQKKLVSKFFKDWGLFAKCHWIMML